MCAARGSEDIDNDIMHKFMICSVLFPMNKQKASFELKKWDSCEQVRAAAEVELRELFTELAVVLTRRCDKTMNSPCTCTLGAEYQRVTAVEAVTPEGATYAIVSSGGMNDIVKAMSKKWLQC